MPKVTGTKIQKLEELFRLHVTLTPIQIRKAIPNANPAVIIWQLQWKRGMTIEREKDDRHGKIMSYTFRSDIPGTIINGSKRIWDEQQKQKKRKPKNEPQHQVD